MLEKDFILTWDWEYDADFINRFRQISESENTKTVFVSHSHIEETIHAVESGDFRVKVLLDRASDTDEAFDPLIDRIILSGTKTLNEARYAIKAMDKATMHLEFLSKRIDVPHSIIFSPSCDFNKLEEKQLDIIGRPFIVKPAYGGGGEGVEEAGSINEIKKIHSKYEEKKYLLQEKMFPMLLDSRRAYFRVYYICGYTIPCWWDDKTHIFGNRVTGKEEKKYNLKNLVRITENIAAISKLDFFSTELCLTEKKRFVVVDYVNDPCDMRLASRYIDGVPDKVIDLIIRHIIHYVKIAKMERLTPLRKEFIKRRRAFELKLLRRYR